VIMALSLCSTSCRCIDQFLGVDRLNLCLAWSDAGEAGSGCDLVTSGRAGERVKSREAR
jgi:hypothetical protein